MMFLTTFLKRKYAGQIGMFFCLVMFLAGCAGKDEAMVLIPSGEDVATELTTLENVEQDAEITPGTTMLPETTEDDPHMVYVYVCGAVRDPGVVEVPEGSRA